MAQRPMFGALTTTKAPEPEPEPEPVETEEQISGPPFKAKERAPQRIQTSLRLQPAVWAALKELATSKRLETGHRVTVHDLLVEGARHVLAMNGVKLP